MQSQPVESQFSPDLLEDSEPVDGHIQVSTQPESQGSPDLLDPSQLSDFSCSPVQELPELPCLPELSDFSQRTDYQDPTTTDNQDPTTGNIGVQLNEPVGQSQANKRASRSRISFMNRCVRATKSFFLLYSEGTLYDEIDNHLYLNGKVITVPRKGITVYEIVWDTSTIPHIIINDSHLRRIVSRDDIIQVLSPVGSE